MKRKILTFLLALGCTFGMGAFAACGDSGNTSNSGSNAEHNVLTVQTAYVKAQELGYEGSLEEFIKSISGKDGANGKDGIDGVGIANISVNKAGELVVVFSNGITVNLGNIIGQDGKDGVGVSSIAIINNELVFTLSDGSVTTVYEYDSTKMTIINGLTEAALKACDGAGIDAVYTCEACGFKYCLIRVRMPHTKPTEKAEDNVLVQGKYITVEKTCTTDGYDEWYCTVCQTQAKLDAMDSSDPAKNPQKDNYKVALGHAWVYGEELSSLPTYYSSGWLTISCSVEGCIYENGTDIQLPALDAKLEDGVTPFYAIRELAGKCEEVIGTEYTISAAQMAALMSDQLGLGYVKAEQCKAYTFIANAVVVEHHFNYDNVFTWTDVETIVGSGETIKVYETFDVNGRRVKSHTTLLEGVTYTLTKNYIGVTCDECGKIVAEFGCMEITTAWAEVTPAT